MEEAHSPGFPHRMCKPVYSLTADISFYLLAQTSNCRHVQSLAFTCKLLQLQYPNRFSLAQCLPTGTFSHRPAPKGEQLGLNQHKISVFIHILLNGRTAVLAEKGHLQKEEEQLWLRRGMCGRGGGSGGACCVCGAVTLVQGLRSIPAQSTSPLWCVLMVSVKQRRFWWKATFQKQGGEEIYAENPCKKNCEEY